MKKIQKGFTLIELMIVVAIIGILAAVAIPAYQDYVVKAKLSKVQSTLDSLKLALAMFYQENGAFPVGTDTTAGLWSSIGITGAPVIPAEVSSLKYLGVADNFGIGLTFQGIKATTIDGQSIVIGPVTGNTVVAGGTITLAASGVAPGQTAMQWFYGCSTALDPIAKKYFGNCP